MVAVFLQLISGVATSFSPWFWLFCLLRFVTAVATGGSMTTRSNSLLFTVEFISSTTCLFLFQFCFGHGNNWCQMA